MNAYDAVDLFAREMINEIYHSSADEALQDSLVKAVNSVEKTVIATIKAQLK